MVKSELAFFAHASASANATSQHLKHSDDPFARSNEEQLWGDVEAALAAFEPKTGLGPVDIMPKQSREQ